ncbi:MAG: bifunctional [glutamate--ammonia ligase]-adenylyl-L-tyrosine phosphorylase/[glutamate--ammonia-ligase] adenylyltransferase [Verrucomicrobiales bacterium]
MNMDTDQNPAEAMETAIQNAADPERAAQYVAQLRKAGLGEYFSKASAGQCDIYAALLAGSTAMSEMLVKHPDWIEALHEDYLKQPRRGAGLNKEIKSWLEPALKEKDYSGALGKIRLFKEKEMLRIAARDLAGIGSVPEIIQEISTVADLCVEVVCQVSLCQLKERFGSPYTQEITGKWQASEFCVLGMGKHGGQELNYSSDIDVIFVYSGEGDVFKSNPAKSEAASRTISNHQFYKLLSEKIIAEFGRLTAEGSLFRIDLRLRPEGKNGPLARSLGSYESYYAQWGQTWERMMLIKARPVAGDQVLGAEFLEMIQPFRYPRSISEAIPREVAVMKQRIENEVVRSGELDRNVKLGRGGIREIEFTAQMLQVLHGGKLPFLQSPQTLPALDKLAQYNLLEKKEVEQLKEIYQFLRQVEHRLQMEDNRQTHTIPLDKSARLRLAKLMQFPSIEAFETALREKNDFVRSVYQKYIKTEEGDANQLPQGFETNKEPWTRLLAEHSFRDAERGWKLIQEFVEGPGFGHVSSRTSELARQLIRKFLDLCPNKSGLQNSSELSLSDPDRVIARVDSFVSAYGARSMLYEAWASNPSLFKLLLVLFDRSEFLAELAIRQPDLVEEIQISGQLRRHKTREQILEDLRHGFEDVDQHVWLRKYYQAEQMRIGLRDILEMAEPRQIEEEITAVAEAFLAYALEVVTKGSRKSFPFSIFGLGKLGGSELIYASDLDIFFVAPDKVKDLSALQKIAAKLMELLSSRTERGTTFETDARLRPDGKKGLLVNTFSGFQDYYRKRAMLWEVQSLSRARGIVGDAELIQKFEQMAQEVTDFSRCSSAVTAFTPEWKAEVHRMRLRIENERTPAGKQPLAIKTGKGGLMDVEFVAQALALENGWHEPNTIRSVERAIESGKIDPSIGTELKENYLKLLNYERILRRWSFEPESVLPEDPAPLYRVAVRCGFPTSEAFLKSVAETREIIRRNYLAYFQPATETL